MVMTKLRWRALVWLSLVAAACGGRLDPSALGGATGGVQGGDADEERPDATVPTVPPAEEPPSVEADAGCTTRGGTDANPGSGCSCELVDVGDFASAACANCAQEPAAPPGCGERTFVLYEEFEGGTPRRTFGCAILCRSYATASDCSYGYGEVPRKECSCDRAAMTAYANDICPGSSWDLAPFQDHCVLRCLY
jgi:hypothetical protein